MYNKYHNTKVYGFHKQYDSRKELNRAIYLKSLERQGKIQGLQEQVVFELIPAQFELVGKKKKCLERAVKYIADFVYFVDGVRVVEDTKGIKTPEYIIKRKLMLYIHNIRIREI